MSADFSGVIAHLRASIDRTAGGPVGRQLQEGLRSAVRTGTLCAGDRLPSTRQLADALGCSRGLVVSAYEQLVAEGYLVSAVGSGTRVAEGARSSQRNEHEVGAPADPTADNPTPSIDFGYGVPDLRSFPARDWLRALGEAMRSMPTAALGDGPPEGDPELRDVLAGYHRRVRGGAVEASRTVVTGGFRQGLAFVLAALAAHGMDSIALEDPGPRDHDLMAQRAGLLVHAVPVDDEGADIAALGGAVRAVLLTPSHQCPTGTVLSPERRHRLIEWANDVDGVVLEDDYDAEFRYDRQPVGSLQGLAPDRVIALGSVSKTLAPGLRIGWIFAPPRFLEQIVTEKVLTGRGVPQLDQAALARFIASGRFDRHLRSVRETYRERRDALVAAVDTHMGGASIDGLDAGHHVVLRLPDGVDERQLVRRAAGAGLAVRGLSDYRVRVGEEPEPEPEPAPALVIGFGNVTSRQIREGVGIIASLTASSLAAGATAP